MSTIDTRASEIQVCQHDLSDDVALFVTACEPMYTAGRPVHVDAPVELGASDATWPQFATVQELDEFIAALQAQRDWLAEKDSDARWLMTPGHTIDGEGVHNS